LRLRAEDRHTLGSTDRQTDRQQLVL